MRRLEADMPSTRLIVRTLQATAKVMLNPFGILFTKISDDTTAPRPEVSAIAIRHLFRVDIKLSSVSGVASDVVAMAISSTGKEVSSSVRGLYNALTRCLTISSICCGVTPSNWSGFSSSGCCGGVISCTGGVDMKKYKCEIVLQPRYEPRDQPIT